MLTAQGFKRLRVADYLPVIQQQARELFGEDADLSDRTPLGKFIYLQALQRAEDNEVAEMVWNSRFVDTSEGASLEANVKRALLTKKRWLRATGEVLVNLDKGTTVPAGYLFKTRYNVYFRTLNEVKAIEDGNYPIEVECTEYGVIGNVEAGDISLIVNNLDGINLVTNPSAFYDGQDEESDAELQERYYQSLSKTGSRRIESLEANVLDVVPGVRACVVIENDTMEVDADGRPPKSFETVVLGGEDIPIAEAIFEKKPGGIQAYGKTYTHRFTDGRGLEHVVGFTRATTVPVYVKIFKKINNQFPLQGDEQLIRRAIEYIGGTHEGRVYNGVGMSTNVIQARLESRLFAVEGLVDVRVELSTDGENFEPKNVVIAFPEVAETDLTKIEVLPLE